MNFFNLLGGAFGFISITEKNNVYTLSGINTRYMSRDIQKIWKTSKVNDYMFVKVTRNSLSFHSFYALEVYYVIQQIVKYRNKYTGIRTLAAMLACLEEKTWVGSVVKNEERVPFLTNKALNEFVYKPLAHQQTFFTKYANYGRSLGLRGYLLAAAPGSGKTYTALLWDETLESDYTIVVGPRVASERVWESSVKTGIGTPCVFKHPRSICVWWRARENKEEYKGERYLYIHYEDELNRLDELFKQILPYMKGKKVRIILDESHGVVNIRNDRTMNFITLANNALISDVLFMSGTPIKAMGQEVVPMMRVIDPLFTPPVEESFKKIFGKDGGRALDILAHRMGFITHRVTREELNLGDPIDEELKVSIPNGVQYTLPVIKVTMGKFIAERTSYYQTNRGVYDRIYLDCVEYYASKVAAKDELIDFDQYQQNIRMIRNTTDYRSVSEAIRQANLFERKKIEPVLPRDKVKDFRNAKSVYKYPSLKIMGECLGRVLGRLRIQCHLDMVSHIDILGICESVLKKTVVFTSYVEVLEAMNQHCIAQGLFPTVVYGKNSADMDRLVRRFASDDQINPLIATFESLSTAVPLIMANQLLMLNVPFRGYKHEQAVARINRIGKEGDVKIISAFLDTGDVANISTRSKDIMEWSKQQVEQILGFTATDIETEVTDYSTVDGVGVSLEAFDIEEEIKFIDVQRSVPALGMEQGHALHW